MLTICVSLFTREWIEIHENVSGLSTVAVSLFTREWIEIQKQMIYAIPFAVSLFTREWIEIVQLDAILGVSYSLPLYEGVD